MDFLVDLLISSFPILMLIVVLVFFMLRMTKKGNPQDRMLEMAEENLKLQERIALALEKIAQKDEAGDAT